MTTPDGPFWELVKAEFRATWCGPWRWLWRGVTIVSALILLFVPTNDPYGILTPVWLYLALVPLVLGSDVASIAFPGNPTPLRQWPFRSLQARAIGRFLPWLMASVPMQIAWIARIAQGFWFLPPPDGLDFFAVLYTTLGILAVTFSSFTLAAMVSLAFRRPHRMLVAVSVQAILLGVSFAVNWLVSGGKGVTRGQALMLLTEPLDRVLVEFNLWFGERLGVSTDAQPLDPGMLVSPIVVIGASVVFWLWFRAVIERRLKRHPYTAK